jgi:hypothetical protein
MKTKRLSSSHSRLRLRTLSTGGVALVSVTFSLIFQLSSTNANLSDLIADETCAYSLPFPS